MIFLHGLNLVFDFVEILFFRQLYFKGFLALTTIPNFKQFPQFLENKNQSHNQAMIHD